MIIQFRHGLWAEVLIMVLHSGACSTRAVHVGEMERAFKFWSVNLKGRLLERYKYRWEDNIKINPKEIYWEVVDCNCLVSDWCRLRVLVNVVMNFWVPYL
jgi:hypothetical protein